MSEEQATADVREPSRVRDELVYLYLLEQYDDEVSEDKDDLSSLLEKCSYNEPNGSVNDLAVQRFLFWVLLQQDSVQRDILMQMLECHREYIEERFKIDIEQLREKALYDRAWREFFQKIEDAAIKIMKDAQVDSMRQSQAAFEKFMKSVEALKMLLDFMIKALDDYIAQQDALIAKIRDKTFPAVINLFEGLPDIHEIKHIKDRVINVVRAAEADVNYSLKKVHDVVAEAKKDIFDYLGTERNTLSGDVKSRFNEFRKECEKKEADLLVGSNLQDDRTNAQKLRAALQQDEKALDYHEKQGQQSFFAGGIESIAMHIADKINSFKNNQSPVDSNKKHENKSEFENERLSIKIGLLKNVNIVANKSDDILAAFNSNRIGSRKSKIAAQVAPPIEPPKLGI